MRDVINSSLFKTAIEQLLLGYLRLQFVVHTSNSTRICFHLTFGQNGFNLEAQLQYWHWSLKTIRTREAFDFFANMENLGDVPTVSLQRIACKCALMIKMQSLDAAAVVRWWRRVISQRVNSTRSFCVHRDRWRSFHWEMRRDWKEEYWLA